MKVLAIVGTPLSDGLTARLCREVLGGAREQGHEVDRIDLYDHEVHDCLACWQCYEHGECVQEDDFAALFERLRAAEAVVLGSPVYIGSVTGKMKTFMDRHLGYAIYNPRGAPDFWRLGWWRKLFTLHREMLRFGARDDGLRGKKFVLVTASTLPFPYSHLTGEVPLTLRCLQAYVQRLEGKTVGRLVYTDTLLRFMAGKEERMMRRARRLGRRLVER